MRYASSYYEVRPTHTHPHRGIALVIGTTSKDWEWRAEVKKSSEKVFFSHFLKKIPLDVSLYRVFEQGHLEFVR